MNNNLPFQEIIQENIYIRTFSESVPDEELKWHRDHEDRLVIPTHETDWLFQRDNELPQKINEEIQIKAGEWHRIIKGTSDLTLKIIKS
jgi:hypothetical protein